MRIFPLREHTKPAGISLLLFVVALALGITVQNSIRAAGGPGLRGIWKVVELQQVKPDGTVRDVAVQESFVIFTDTHYSMSFATGTKATSPEPKFSMTDSAKLNRYLDMVVNAGTYKVRGSTLTVHPTFAKVPDFVNGEGTFDLGQTNDSLTLKWRMTTSPDGTQQPYFAAGGHSVLRLKKVK